MDDNSKAGAPGPQYDSRVTCAGSQRKRSCPSDTHQGDGGGDGSINHINDESAARRQRASLSLLARCALNHGNPVTNSNNLLGGQNQPFQLPSGYGPTGHPYPQSTNNALRGTGPQNMQNLASPGGTLTQNASLLQGAIPPTTQGLMGMQPNTMLHQGQTQPRYLTTSIQPPSVPLRGTLLRPFGMSPQELLNYAVLVNILHKSVAQGNAVTASLAFNCSQAMMQTPNSTEAGPPASNPLSNYPQLQGGGESVSTFRSNQTHEITLTDSVQADINNDANWSSAGSGSGSSGSSSPSPPARTSPQQQDYSEPPQLATNSNQSHVTTLNNRVQTAHNYNSNGGSDASSSPVEIYPPRQGRSESLQLAQTNEPLENTPNGGLHNAPPTNNDVARTGGMNNGNANTPSVSRRSDTLPSHVLQAEQNPPSMRRVPLWAPEDEERLSTQQCWLRMQIETFPASARDVRTRGRNRLLDIGQVGIQCTHCKNLPQEGRGKGSSYFPASIKSIYQSAQNMLTFHYKEDTCPLIPRRLLQQMRDAGETSAICPRMAPKAGKSRAGGGKSYWESSAATITGLVDTTVGISYSDNQNYRPLESIALASDTLDQHDAVGLCQTESSVLTRIEDRGKVTDFCFILMSQFEPYCSPVSMPSSDMMDGDEWDIENEEPLPTVGIACHFCKGVSDDGKQSSKGIFLSSKADTMSRNKNLARMYNHLLICATEDIKASLIRAKNIHLPQSDRLKKGWKKQFFENVCRRLYVSLEASEDEDDQEHL